MNIKPVHASIGDVFGEKTIFTVPKYQRGYAWDEESVADFISDVEVCYKYRASQTPREHFLGGVLSIKSDIEGVANAVEYELVDGQQRITTLTLFAFALREKFEELNEELEDDDHDLAGRISHYVNDLTKSFVAHDQVVNKVVSRANVLTLSRKDESFFRAMLAGRDVEPKIDSQEKLSSALLQINDFVNSLVDVFEDISEKVDVLDNLHDVLASDFSMLHMIAENKPDAYRLFQVINDRGVSLTDGDLLRVRTLELLTGFDAEQDAAELIWDDILSDKPSKTYDYLQWIYESYANQRARAGALADVYMEYFFVDVTLGASSKKAANKILAQLELIQTHIGLCRQLTQGEWIFPSQRPVTPWERARLASLIVYLGHSLCIPLLLTASTLGHVKFRDIVLMLERSFYRYKVICNEHVTPLKSLYYSESKAMRLSGAAYNVDMLKQSLTLLLDQRAPMQNFVTGVTALHYQAKGGGNKSIKHLLLLLDSYYAWYADGAVGSPRCLEGNRLLDFAETSIEHIYPKGAKPADVDADMEPRKNSLGNLTVLDPEINRSADNKSFADKREVFKASSIALNVMIGKKLKWNLRASQQYERDIISMVKKIFVA